jgi:hypothetical protein
MSTQNIKHALRKQSVGYIAGALSLVAGLAWNDVVKDLIMVLFPLQTNSLWAKLFYAGVITVVATVITVYLTKASESEEEK